MKKVVLSLFLSLYLFGCGEESLFSQNYQHVNNTYIDDTIYISSGSVVPENPIPETASLYTITSNIPPITVYNATSVDYSLNSLDNTSMTASALKVVSTDNKSDNQSDNYSNDPMRAIIKQQIDFNNKAKENNYKPLSNKQNNNIYGINYKTVPDNIIIGTQWNNIYVMNTPSTSNAQSITSATCVGISDNVYYFVDDSIANLINTTLINQIKVEFEKGYLSVHEKCGTENDIDNNGKIIFLFTPIEDNVLGFFYTADKYSNNDTIQSGIHSNEAEIMYINSRFLMMDNATFQSNKRLLLATLIHEFHHMALFDVRTRLGYAPFMDYYINEGLSTLSSYYAGYPDVMYDYVVAFFTREMSLPLVNNTQNLSYGYSYLFMRYFYSRFGDEGLKKLIQSPYTDYRAFESGSGIAFNELYKDFLKMMLVTGRNITTDTRYNVDEFNYKIGTTGYVQSYISLADLLDSLSSGITNSGSFITNNGYNATNVPAYTFQYKKWSTKPTAIHLQGTNTTTFYSLF